MDVPLLLDHEFDFFAAEPVPGLAEAPDNHNWWIEWDVPLGGEMDEPMENPGFDDEEELNEFMDGGRSGWESIPRVGLNLEGLVSDLQTLLHGVWLQNQQLQTRLSDMEKREGTWITYMSWMENHLAVLEKKLTGPPTGPQ
ncbi:hypothetical protein Tco_0461652 [Tanacetum coccineum]